MAVTSIKGQSTPAVKTCGISGANGISSSATILKTTSSTTSNVSSATIKTTPSTTQTTNSSKTSSVKYSSATISSSTTSSSKTASTTSNAKTGSTTSKTSSSAISSSTTVANKNVSSTTSNKKTSSTTSKASSTTSSTTISSVSSTTTRTITIKMYSSATPEGKDVTIEVPVEHETDDRTDDAREMIKDRLSELGNKNVEVGISYSLGELPLYLGDAFVKFSSEIEFHENDEDAFVSYSSEIDASVTEITDFYTDEISVEFFKGGTISFTGKTMTMCLEKDGYSMEIDVAALMQYRLDVTVSKSIELGDTATLTNSINFVKDIDRPDNKSALEEAWDSICEGVDIATEWVKDNEDEIMAVVNTVGTVALTAGCIIAGSPTAAVGAATMFGVSIYNVYEEYQKEVQ